MALPTAACVLRRFLAILFLLVLLLSNTELYQLLKLPVLLEHYREHQSWSKGISFMEFLRMHYAGNDGTDADYERDQQLPFKTHATAEHMNPPVPVPVQPVALAVPFKEVQTGLFSFYSDWLPSARQRDIFQPPRLS